MGVHALIYSAAFSIPALFGFIAFTALTHILSPYEYGIYSTGLNFSFFAGSVFFSWIRFSAGRYEAEAKGNAATAFWLKCFVSTAPVAAVSLWLVSLSGRVSTPIMACVFVLSCCQGLFELVQEIRRARHQAKSFARYNLARSGISALMAMAVAYVTRSGLALLGTLSLSFGLATVVGLLGGGGAQLRNASRNHSIKVVAAYGASMALSGMVFSSAGVITRLIVAHFSGLTASGSFNAALDLSGQAGAIVAMSVYSVIAPSIIKSYANGDRESVVSQFEYGGELLLAVIAPTTVGMMLISSPLAALLTGPAYHDLVSQLLPLTVLGVAIWNCNHYYVHIAFQITSRPMLQALYGVVQLCLISILTIVLVAIAGPVGAAWAQLIAYSATLVLSFWLARSVFPIPIPRAALPKVAFSTLTMTFVVVSVQGRFETPVAQLAVAVLAGAAVYFVCALAANLCGLQAHLRARIRRARMTVA